MRAVLYAVAISLATSLAAADQASSDVEAGARIRVTLAKGRSVAGLEKGGRRGLAGRVVDLDGQTLTVLLDGRATTVTLPRQAIGRLDVSEGRRSRGAIVARRTGKGLLIGALAGAAIGLSQGDDVCTPVGRDQLFGCFLLFSAGDKAAMGGILLGTAGGLAGLISGAVTGPQERWRPVATKKLAVSLEPTRGRGMGLAVTLGF